jgi:hypothetical protein
MKTAILYFHQGFTDIMNCLPLVNFYNKQYDRLNVVIRQDCLNMLSFYIRHLNNIYIIPIIKDTAVGCVIDIYSYGDVLFIGDFDILRNDIYRGIYERYCKEYKNKMFFVEKFYTPYGVDYKERIESFEFVRDYELEDKKYNDIIKNNKEYILYHDIESMEIIPKNEEYDIIQLDHISDLFFDCIKILENAKEIHLIDSVWASFIYLMDCRYKFFHHLNIYVHCKRSFFEYYTAPVKLDHWILI